MRDRARASDAEALRLTRAFFRIGDRRLRRRLIELVEACSGEEARPHLVSAADGLKQDHAAVTERRKH